MLNRSALYGVLTEIEALGLDLLEIRNLSPDSKITRIRRQPLTLTATTVGGVRFATGRRPRIIQCPVRDPLAGHLNTPDRI